MVYFGGLGVCATVAADMSNAASSDNNERRIIGHLLRFGPI